MRDSEQRPDAAGYSTACTVERSGYLLSRGWRDTAQGIELTLWAATTEGPLRILIENQEAVCFSPREQQIDLPTGARRKPLALKLLGGGPVDAVYCRQQRVMQSLRESPLILAEADIKPTDRYLMERFINAGFVASGSCRRENGVDTLRNPRLRPYQHIPVLKVLSLDIETRGGSNELYSIAGALALSSNTAATLEAQVFMVGPSARVSRGGYELEFHPGETQLLHAFFAWMKRIDPDVIIGWNIVNFDLQFLDAKCRALDLSFALGRAAEAAAVLKPTRPGQPRVARVPGRAVLDGVELLRAGFWAFDSFSLDNVANELLGEGKLISSGQNKVAEINRQFRDDKPQLADYNMRDCTLVNEIFAKADLVAFAVQRANLTGLPLDRLGGSVAAFDNLYLPRLHRRGFVAPPPGAEDAGLGSPGGYILDSVPGLYENVLVFDFKSLYPSIIRTFHIDPLGLAEPGPDPIPGFLDASFSRNGSILPDLIEQLWAAREQARRERNAPLTQAIKIIMNSFYGVLGSSGCRFHSAQLASSITRRGHQIITRSRDWIEAQGYQVIYGDTDSLFTLLDGGVSVECARVTGARLASGLNTYWRNTLAKEIRLDSCLEVVFETHYSRFLMPTVRGMPTGSKKRYAGLIRLPDGEARLVVKGLEAARTDWTPLARDFQRELFRRVFLDMPYDDYIRNTAVALTRGEFDDALVYRKRLRRRLSDYQRNAPPHVQAARKQHSPGRWIRYVMTTQGPEPVESLTARPDYQHYLDRQLAPAADGILQFLGSSFDAITDAQMQMF